jgi:hypothetical protein
MMSFSCEQYIYIGILSNKGATVLIISIFSKNCGEEDSTHTASFEKRKRKSRHQQQAVIRGKKRG